MKAVIQRVTRASVRVEGKTVGRIESGLLVLLGVAKGDGETDGRYLAEKIRTLRIFSDEQGKMNCSLSDIGGSVLLVSQFTLLARMANGRRPSFDAAATPDEAKRLYEGVATGLRGTRDSGSNRRLCRTHAGRIAERRAGDLCLRQPRCKLAGC